MGVHRTCGEPNEIKKNTPPQYVTVCYRPPFFSYGEQAPRFDAVYSEWEAGTDTQARARVVHSAPAGDVRV